EEVWHLRQPRIRALVPSGVAVALPIRHHCAGRWEARQLTPRPAPPCLLPRGRSRATADDAEYAMSGGGGRPIAIVRPVDCEVRSECSGEKRWAGPPSADVAGRPALAVPIPPGRRR